MIRDDEGDSIDPFLTDEQVLPCLQMLNGHLTRRVLPVNSIPELMKSE